MVLVGGPFWGLVALFVGALVFGVLVRWRLGPEGRTWEDRLWGAGLAGLVVWKLSPLVDLPRFGDEPWLALLAPGTDLGFVVGLGLALALFGAALFRRGAFRGPGGRHLALALATAVLSGLVVVGAASVALAPAEAAQRPQTKPLVLPTLDGAAESLEEADGRVVVVNFWATWCPPCRAELPDLQAFWAAADPDRVAFRAVNLITTEPDLATVRAFVRDRNLAFPVVLDDAQAAVSRYGVETIPTTLVFDGEGTLIWRTSGPVTRAQLEAAVRAGF